MNKPCKKNWQFRLGALLAVVIVFTSLISGCADTLGDGRILYQYSLTVVSGDNQTVKPDGDESEPIVVRVDLNGSPANGLTVQWTITEGDGSLSSDSGVSDEDGLVQTTYISGNSAGDVRIRANVIFDASGFIAQREVTPVSFTLNVTTD